MSGISLELMCWLAALYIVHVYCAVHIQPCPSHPPPPKGSSLWPVLKF